MQNIKPHCSPFWRVYLINIILFLIFSCSHTEEKTPDVTLNMEEMPRSVTIYRDTYGVPHIYGPTDASVVFGFAYARAEDEFFKIENYYARALGKSSVLLGEEGFITDYVVRALEIEQLSKEEYARASPEIRILCDAFAGGINYFIKKNPHVKPRLFSHFESWYVLAGERAFWHIYILQKSEVNLKDVSSVALSQKKDPSDTSRLVAFLPEIDAPYQVASCNAAAISPAKSATGNAMLLLNQHQKLDADYEVHLHSDEGWNFSGVTFYGYGILPAIGYNEHLGWTFTENQVDCADVYEETFDNPEDPLLYRFGNSYRTAREWTETINVKKEEGLEERTVAIRKTHHGPILFKKDGKNFAVRVAKVEEGGILQQLYSMNKARNLKEFKKALSQNALVIANIVYADKKGNIYYLYNGSFPRRSPRFDWLKPVDGSNPETEWKGYHTIEELPQVLNPESGFVQSCNNIPFTTTNINNPKESDYPAYMVVNEKEMPRSKMIRRILSSKKKFTFEEWARLPFNNYVLEAEEKIPQIIEEWNDLRKTDVSRTEALRGIISELSSWDHTITTSSVASTLFILWYRKMYSMKNTSEKEQWLKVRNLEEVTKRLKQDFGSWRIPYGDIFRHQRRDVRINQPFSDDRSSLPVSFGPGSMGILAAYKARPGLGLKRQYGVSGHSYVSVVEFSKKPKALSILAYGQSMDPESPHYFDQASLCLKGEYKPSWFSLSEIKKNLESSYHPGERNH